MYKKIKATKNNSFKRAMVVSSIAALASAGIISTSGVVNFDGGSTASAVPFGGLGGGFFGRGYGFNNRRDTLTENQQENYDIFVRNTNKIVESVSRALNLNTVMGSVGDAISGDNLNSNSGESIVQKALKSFSESSEGPYKSLDRFLRGGSGSGFSGYGRYNVNDPSTYAKFMAALVKKLKEVQTAAAVYLLEIGNLLYCDKIKNSEKLRKLEKALDDIKFKAPKSLLKLANLGGVTSTSKSTEEARDMAEKAFKAFLNGKSLTMTESESGDSWESYGYTSWNKIGRSSSKVSPQLRSLYYVFQTLLNISAGVNGVFAEIFGYTYMWYLQQYLKVLGMRSANNFYGMARVGKRALMQGMAEDYSDSIVGAVPLLLLPDNNEGDDVLGVLLSDIKHNKSQFVSHVVKALQNRSNVRDYLSTLMNYADDKASKADVGVDDEAENGPKPISYDMAKVMQIGAGETVAKDGFADMDEVIRDFLSQPKDDYKQKFGLTDEQIEELELAKQRFDSNNPVVRFESSNGQPLPFQVVATLRKDNTKFIEKVLSLPATLRLRAAVDIVLNDIQAAANGSNSYWDVTSKTFVDDSKFAQGASNEVSWLQTILKDCFTQRDAIAKYKNIEVDKSKSSKSSSASGGRITNKLVLNGDNTNADSSRAKFSATDSSIQVTLEGLSNDIQAISAVVCPKTSSDGKTGNKNVDLPLAAVANGKCTIDLTNVVKERGNYEIHFRNAKLDPATPITSPQPRVQSYEFLYKAKISLDANSNVKRISGLKPKTVEQAKDNFLDFSTAQLFFNDDKSITFRIKSGSDKSYDGLLTAVFFKQGQGANLSNDKFVLQREEGSDWYFFTTNKAQEGSLQFHIYRGEVEGKNYDGKVEFSTGDTTDIVEDGKSPIMDAVAKSGANYAVDNTAATVTKNVKIVLPIGALDDYEGGSLSDLEYTIVRVSDGERYYSKKLNLKNVKYDDKSRTSGVASIELPPSNNEYRIVIEALGLESRSTVTSQIENGKEVEFSQINDSDFGFRNYF